jgi:hypothetical protein
MEPSGPLRACNGIALPFYMPRTSDILVYNRFINCGSNGHHGMINGCEAFKMYQIGNFLGRNFNVGK